MNAFLPDPLARPRLTVAPVTTPTDEVCVRLPSGATYRMAPRLDERCRCVVGGNVVVARNSREAEELAREANLWGVKGVRFGV